MFSASWLGFHHIRFVGGLVVFLTMLLTAQSLIGKTVPGRWEKVKALEPGSSISVLLISGELVEGKFERLDRDVLLLRTGQTTESILKNSVYRVTEVTVEKDSGVKGALWGLAAGTALGGILVASDGSAGFVSDPGGTGFTGTLNSGGNDWEKKGVMVAGSAAIGCLLGFLIDVSVDPVKIRRDVIYQAH